MLRTLLIALGLSLVGPLSADANDYNPHEMPGTYQYCQRQLDDTLRQIDWQSAADQVEDRVQQARRRYEQCLSVGAGTSAGGPPVR